MQRYQGFTEVMIPDVPYLGGILHFVNSRKFPFKSDYFIMTHIILKERYWRHKKKHMGVSR